MKLKIFSLITAIALILCLFCGCTDDSNQNSLSTSSEKTSSVQSKEEPKKITYLNNLTGCMEFDSAEQVMTRPVAVMVNNLSKAQKVQTGLSKASIVYETVVEGGITRLLAIFKSFDDVGDIGTIRSARYSYLDLANGHDALYFHCGADEIYFKPYANQLSSDHIDINVGVNNKYGKRVKNGLESEHTMYTSASLITKALSDKNRRTQLKSDSVHANMWQNFAPEDKTVTYNDGVATKASVFFSASYVTTFNYDTSTKMYVKSNKSGNSTDYKTGKKNSYKNVLVLFARVTNFADNYHTKVHLDSGNGYYLTNGTLKQIKWSKGNSNSPFKITDLDGNTVEFNAGNTYVCIPPASNKDKTSIS